MTDRTEKFLKENNLWLDRFKHFTTRVDEAEIGSLVKEEEMTWEAWTKTKEKV